jgi:hypothetical protein
VLLLHGPLRASKSVLSLHQRWQHDGLTAPHYSVLCTCRYDLKLRLFRPLSATWLQQCFGWATGMPAELADPRMSGLAEGREGAVLLHVLHLGIRPDVTCAHCMCLQLRACGSLQIAHMCLRQHIMRYCSAVLCVKASGHVNVQVDIVTQVMGAAPASCAFAASFRHMF